MSHFGGRLVRGARGLLWCHVAYHCGGAGGGAWPAAAFAAAFRAGVGSVSARRHSASCAVGEGAVKQWIQRYRTPAGAERVETVEDLEGRFGESIRYLAAEPISAYKFCRALYARSPPLVITDAVAKQWLRQYGGQRKLRRNVVAPT